MNALRSKWRETICLYFALISVILLGTVFPAFALTPRDRIRPLRGGIQITNEDGAIGSIGFTAYYVEHIPGFGSLYRYGFVTASHLTDTGDDVYQPTISVNNYVGGTTKDPSFPRSSDSAFVYTETVLYGEQPSTVSPRIFSCRSITNYDYVVGYRTRAQMFVGEQISKVGRTTYCTSGQITGFRGQVNLGGGIVINNVVLANYNAAGGDSGGVVYRLQSIPPNPEYPAPALIYGAHNGWIRIGWVVHMVFSPTDGVLSDLNVYVYRW